MGTHGRHYLVIFDCDGVLVDSEPTSNRLLAEAITRAGLPSDSRQVAEAFEGLRLGDIQAAVERRLGRALPAQWLGDFEAERAAAFERELAAIPGVAEVLEKVSRAGISMCVASQARPEKTELTLRLTGLDRFFPPDSIFSSNMVERGKPDPDLFQFAAAAMHFRASRCTVVEDSVPGVKAGRAAGMRVLGYSPESKAPRLRKAGAEVFASMADLPALLGLP